MSPHRLHRMSALGTALVFSACLIAPTLTQAETPAKTPIEIKIRVSEKGFLDGTGKPYSAKRPLTITKDTPVTITFIFAEDLTSLAVGDTHQVAVKSDDGWMRETGPFWIMSREASISFLAGENGRTQYRAYCILDCIGMEHLTNLFIQIV